MSSLRILAADPGLAHFGWAVLERDGDLRVVCAGVVRTKPEARKRQSYEMSDRRRRLDLIRSTVSETLGAFPPGLAAMEEISPPRSSSAALMLGMAATTFDTLCWAAGVPVLTHLPQDVRARLGVPRGASKDAVRDAVARIVRIDHLRIQGAEGAAAQHHHAIDAIAVGLVAAESTAAKLIRGRT